MAKPKAINRKKLVAFVLPIIRKEKLLMSEELEKLRHKQYVVVADTEIVSQLHSGGFAGQSEQTGNKINCISVRLASETMKTLVHLHAGILIIVKRADCHAMDG